MAKQPMLKYKMCLSCGGKGQRWIDPWQDMHGRPTGGHYDTCNECNGSGQRLGTNWRWNPFRGYRLKILGVIVLVWLMWGCYASATGTVP